MEFLPGLSVRRSRESEKERWIPGIWTIFKHILVIRDLAGHWYQRRILQPWQLVLKQLGSKWQPWDVCICVCAHMRPFFLILYITGKLSQACFGQGQLGQWEDGILGVSFGLCLRESWWQASPQTSCLLSLSLAFSYINERVGLGPL